MCEQFSQQRRKCFLLLRRVKTYFDTVTKATWLVLVPPPTTAIKPPVWTMLSSGSRRGRRALETATTHTETDTVTDKTKTNTGTPACLCLLY